MLGSALIVDGKTDGRTENRMPTSHLAKAGVTKMIDERKMSKQPSPASTASIVSLALL